MFKATFARVSKRRKKRQRGKTVAKKLSSLLFAHSYRSFWLGLTVPQLVGLHLGFILILESIHLRKTLHNIQRLFIPPAKTWAKTPLALESSHQGPRTRRQTRTHAHSIERFAYEERASLIVGVIIFCPKESAKKQCFCSALGQSRNSNGNALSNYYLSMCLRLLLTHWEINSQRIHYRNGLNSSLRYALTAKIIFQWPYSYSQR